MTPDDPTPPRPSDPIFPADPRLTAYSFGELEGEDLPLIEAALANDETLRAVVDELRAFGENLTTTLAAEIADENKDGSAISETIAGSSTHVPADNAAFTKRSAEPKRRGVLLRFPFALSYLAPALAACLAVVFWIQNDNTHQRDGAIPAPVALARQVPDTPVVNEASNIASVARMTTVAEAKSDVAPSVSFSPVPPAPSSHAAFETTPTAPASAALMERDVAAPLFADAAPAALMHDGFNATAVPESKVSYSEDSRVSEKVQGVAAAKTKTMVSAEFGARSVPVNAAAKAAPAAKVARINATSQNVTQVVTTAGTLADKDSVMGGALSSGGLRLRAWADRDGYVRTDYAPSPQRYFSTTLFPVASVYPNTLPQGLYQQDRGWGFFREREPRDELLYLLWGPSYLNRVMLVWPVFEKPTFDNSSKAPRELRSSSLTPLIDWSFPDIDMSDALSNRCSG